MKQIIGVKTVKMGVGATISIILAQGLGFKYAASAGIITLLSIQNTRRESVEIAFRRIVATIIALAIGSCLFSLLGYHAVVFGVYLLVFIPIAARLKVTQGVVPASVLVTHILGDGKVTAGLLFNEIGLLMIGVIIALLINMYMPSLESVLLKEKKMIDDLLFSVLMDMGKILREEQEKLDVKDKMIELEKTLFIGKKKAHQYTNNYFMSEKSLYEKYFEMRYLQYQILTYLVKHFERFYMMPIQAHKVAVLTDEVALTIKGKVSVEEAMATLENLEKLFKASSLPQTRNEFENRAMLYQFLTDIDQFLEVKKQFKAQLSDKELKEYKLYYHY